MTAPVDDCSATIAQVRARVLEAVARETSVGHRTVRAADGDWETMAPGVERRLLWERGEASSCMLRIAAGTSFPGHGHAIDEECMVLEGSLRVGDVLLHPGDFHVGLSGSDHAAATSEDGCVCFLRTSRNFFEPVS